jgi:hypothetical protein
VANLLITVIVVLIVIGVLLWLLNTYGAAIIDATVLRIINAVAIIGICLWLLVILLQVAGVNLGGGLPGVCS